MAQHVMRCGDSTNSTGAVRQAAARSARQRADTMASNRPMYDAWIQGELISAGCAMSDVQWCAVLCDSMRAAAGRTLGAGYSYSRATRWACAAR
jgi:hypothetical protein